MHNKEIDHLYSFSSSAQADTQQQKQNLLNSHFGLDTIRMKASVGLAGRAFTHQKIYQETDMAKTKHLAQEERDLQKLKLQSVSNVLAIPVIEKQSSESLCVIQVYNYEPALVNLTKTSDPTHP